MELIDKIEIGKSGVFDYTASSKKLSSGCRDNDRQWQTAWSNLQRQI